MKLLLATLVMSLSLLAGCGGSSGGSSGDEGNSNSGPGPVAGVDSDGDGLDDADEIALGTNKDIPDTDGDGFLDKEEVDNWDRFSGTHLRFNPLVADVPRLRVQALGSPVIQLYATTQESGSINKGMTNTNSSEVKVTTDRGRTNVNKIEEQHAVGVNGEVSQTGPITSGSVSASYDYQHTDTTTETNYWNETRVQTNRQASSEYYETLRTETVTTKGGEIKILMGLLNDGDVSYTVNNMELTAFMQNPQQPGDLISVGTLQHQGSMTFTPNPLGKVANPKNSDFTEFDFTYRADGNPEEISRILENSKQLVLKPVNIALTGQRPDIDLNLAAQNIRARTAEVIIDFGEGQPFKTERYRVAINNGNGETLGFDDLMRNRLNFDYIFSSQGFPGKAGSKRGLSSLRSLSMNGATRSYWLLAHTFTPVGSPAGTTSTKLYNILNQDYDASDINLRKGDVLHLVYITDSDLDGLSDRLEILEGTDLNLADSDADSLDDAREYYGWYTNLATAPCDIGKQTLVFGNPLNADTDGDGLSDSDEFNACSNPYGSLIVDAGNDNLVSQGDRVNLSADASNFQNASALSYQWLQTGGVSVGPLPNSRDISFDAPDEVTNLEFQVTVTDTDQNNAQASDQVSVFVARDKVAAVFVDADNGHDFNNTGTSPTSPLASIERALSAFANVDIYLNTPDAGNFYQLADTIALPANANLYGGFDLDWSHDPANAPTPILVNRAVALQLDGFVDTIISGISIEAVAPQDGRLHSQAILASNGGNLLLDRVIARGSDLPVRQPSNADIPSYLAASSFGVLATNLARLDVIDSSIAAGAGANGVKGQTGAVGRPGDRGSNASGITGGGGGSGHNGANGGRGANATGGVVACTGGARGSDGTSSTSTSGSTLAGGSGGAAGTASLSFLTCSSTRGGGGGSRDTTVARTGASGTPAGNPNSFNSAFLVPIHGGTGGRGTGGAGGGGGGSGPGIDLNNGGGGGGGGEGGEGGAGGGGGRGAGGSFGLAVDNVTFVSVVASDISSGRGGTGGAGGNGGSGGTGGGGGTGADSGARKGGNGGQGGKGGTGGAGGGGAGGPVAAVLLTGGSILDIIDTTINTENAGNGINPNRGQGGWNYGIYADNGTIGQSSGVSYQLGSAGNGASTGQIKP
jgi:hypothetical protein